MEGTLGDQEEGCQVQLCPPAPVLAIFCRTRGHTHRQTERKTKTFECTSRHRLCSTLMVVATPGQKAIVHTLPAQYA